MTQEEKQLLFKDLCARLPYGVKCRRHKLDSQVCTMYPEYLGNAEDVEEYEPYLRSLSSMTKEEEEDFKQIIEIELKYLESNLVGHTVESAASSTFEIDFYNSHHFDYRGLIPMGLALEAPEGMYKTN